MFYDCFEKLCKERDKTPAQVRKELGISQSTMGSWKSRGLTPNAATLMQLADYFETTVDVLLGKTKGSDSIKFSNEILYLFRLLDIFSPMESRYHTTRATRSEINSQTLSLMTTVFLIFVSPLIRHLLYIYFYCVSRAGRWCRRRVRPSCTGGRRPP